MDEIETLAFCDQGTKKTESNPFCTITFPQKHILKKLKIFVKKRLSYLEVKCSTCDLPFDVSHEMQKRI